MKKSILAALALIVIFVTSFAGLGGGGRMTKYEKIDHLLDVDGGEPGWMGRKIVEKRAGVCFLIHDGDTTSISEFKAYSDELYDSWSDRWGSTTPKRVRGTFGIVATGANGIGAAGKMTWDDLRSLNQRDFEIALHGDASDRMGPELIDFSYGRIDSMLEDQQATVVAQSIDTLRTLVRTNWRQHPGQEYLLRKHGITQVIALRVPANASNDTLVSSNEQTTMNPNMDQLVSILLNETSFNAVAYQGYGRILNRWNVGSHEGFNDTTTASGQDTTTVAMRQIMDGAVQMGAIATLTFHQFIDDANALSCHPDTMKALMDHADSLLGTYEGFESLTAMQMVARGVGRVVGELVNTHGFARMYEQHNAFLHTSAGLDANADSLKPLLYPYMNSYYTDTPESEFMSASADSDVWKILGAADTIPGAFTNRDGNLDSLTWGWTDSTRNVAVAQSADSAKTAHFMLPPIFVTGVEAPYIIVSVQAGSEDSTDTGYAYLPVQLYQYTENQFDFTIGSTSSTPFRALQSAFGTATYDTPRDSRLSLQSYFGIVDTVAIREAVDVSSLEWATDDSDDEWFRFSPGSLTPIIIDHRYGSGGSALDASFGDNYTALASPHTDQMREFDQSLHWETYTWRVPINGETDIVVGQVRFDTVGGDWTLTNGRGMTGIVIHVSAVAPY